MSGPALAKAKLIPFRDPPKANEPDEARAIPFDFNPETLTLKVSAGEARDPARRGRQQTQNVAASQATLSFDCLFDSTRPRQDDGAGAQNQPVKDRDVRGRTRAIADLLQSAEPGSKPSPKRVRFLWGEFIFDGVVSQHQEVFDYFSPNGVPLRSKVSLTLTEKDFRYDVKAVQAAPLRDGATPLGSGSGSADSGPEASPGPQRRREAALASALLPQLRTPSSAQIGLALAAGLSLKASEALAVFGPAALPPGAVLPEPLAGEPQGLTGQPGPRREPGQPSSAWSRDAAAAGSAAAGLASRVVAQRQAGLDPGLAQRSRSDHPGAFNPPPITGHAQLRPRLALEADPRLFPIPRSEERSPLERRPRWEGAERVRGGDQTKGAGRPLTNGATGCGCGGDPCCGEKP